MNIQRFSIMLTVTNLVLMTIILARLNPASAEKQPQSVTPIVRTRGLEIVDSLGRLRACILVQPVEPGKPGTGGMILRLIDTQGGPLIKLGAGEDGGGISVTDETQNYIQLITKREGGFIKIRNKDGAEKLMKP